MRVHVIGAGAALLSVFAVASAAQAQSRPAAGALDLEAAAGEIGDGWTKRLGNAESLTFVCDAESCGGRGVLGVSQASASEDYVRQVVANPDKALPSYKYGSEESMKATGCAFKDYEVKRRGDRRVLYESAGACPDGSAATMTTIFDLDRPNILSVQVLTKAQNVALALRDRIAGRVVAALDGQGGDPKR